MTVVSWQIDVHAPDRAHALLLAVSSGLPPIAGAHLGKIILREDYVWGGRRNPDGPLRMSARGTDHGSYISIESATLAYL